MRSAGSVARVSRLPRRLGSLGTRKPHAIVARVQPSRALIELQAEHERILQRIGLRPTSGNSSRT